MEVKTLQESQCSTKRSKYILQLVIVVISLFLTVYGMKMFYKYFLFNFNIIGRMIILIVIQWTLMIVPIIIMKKNKTTLKQLGITKDNIFEQIIVGIFIAVIISLLLTVIPILLGFKDMVGSTNYNKPWQFIYEFIYAILGVGLAEEFVFRGYLFNNLLKIKHSKWFAIIVSSILFGLFHIFNGNIIQVFMTGAIGFIYCILREKIKNCTLISLVLAHGLHDALIVLLVAIL
ncbi:MAG: type II CAAX endopeptidase family protein [Bacilli bacterium]